MGVGTTPLVARRLIMNRVIDFIVNCKIPAVYLWHTSFPATKTKTIWNSRKHLVRKLRVLYA